MTVDVQVPALGESITEATVAKWYKAVGEAVAVDEPLCELETDKVAVEVNATTAGVLAEIIVDIDGSVEVGAVLCRIDETGTAAASPKPAAEAAPEPAPTPAPEPAPAPATEPQMMPAAAKLAAEHGLDPATITGTGKDGRITKGDVLAAVAAAAPATEAAPVTAPPAPAAKAPAPSGQRPEGAREERVRMTRLRQAIAGRLKEAQNTAAMLTTFNECDMSALMAARAEYRDVFEKKHGVRLGVMSFFVKACITALKELPAVNGEIDGDEIVYKNYYHIGVAVSAPQGLVVPVLRDADAMSFAEVETAIGDFGIRARDGKLALEELQGGTFTISNGGVFGSLMSTPILNPPQSAILGMHKIQKRPVAVGDKIEIRPMMYLALSYDHRLIDGREAVTFLVRVKDCIEDPKRILLDI